MDTHCSLMIMRSQNQTKGPSRQKWLHELQCMQNMSCYSIVLKKNELELCIYGLKKESP